MMTSSARRGAWLCALSAVCFGVTTPAASQLSEAVAPNTLAGLLYVGAAIALAPFARPRQVPAAHWRSGAPRLTAAVVFGGVIGPALLAFGLPRVPAGTAALMLNMELVFTTLLAWTVFREHIGPRVAVGTALVTLAATALSWTPGFGVSWGALLIAAACFAWAIDNSVTAALDQIPPAVITVVKGVVAGGANLALGLATGPLPSGQNALALLALGAVGYGISMTLWVRGARYLGAARAHMMFATAPFIGAGIAWTLLGDHPTLWQIGAAVLAAAGVGIAAESSHNHEHRHEAMQHAHEHTHGPGGDGHHDHEHPEPVPPGTTHSHPHHHVPVTHTHPHVPDLHHRHSH